MSNLGNKQIMAKNIRYYMNKHSVSQTELCNTLGFKMPTFSDWVNAKTYPRIDKIELMANYFGISKADLVEDHDEYTGKPSTSKSNIVKVLGRVAAGIPLEAITDIVDEEEIPEELARTGEFFGLRISGDSMEPDIHNGDTVIVKRQDDAESDEIVIALVNGNDGVCKRLKKYADSIALISLNPNYEPMYFNQEEIEEKPVKIIGKVVELRRKF